jgi:predicted nucleic acid-binding protein
MNHRYLIDTCVLVDAIGKGANIPLKIEMGDIVFLSTVAIGEFKAGLDSTRRGRREYDALSDFLRLPNVVQITLTPATTDLYAKVFRSLREKGRPIPVNDIWLAAQALEHGAVLVSSDRHFEEVANLQTMILEN